MKVAIVPLDITWGDVEENLISAAERLRHVETGTDIVVLPEMFSTGYISNREQLKIIAGASVEHTLDAIHRWASFFKFAIAGSFITCENGHFYNRGFFIEPSGDETFYDKHHLFSLGGEKDLYTAGMTPPPVFRYLGWNIALSICYDLRFPEWLRNINAAYDLMLLPASWPESRGYAWKHLLIARAIENQSFIVGANRSGKDDHGDYPVANSFIFDYLGRDIGRYSTDGIIHAELDAAGQQKFRGRFTAWKEADPYIFTALGNGSDETGNPIS